MPWCENPSDEHEASEVRAYVAEFEHEQERGGILVVKKRLELCTDCHREWAAAYSAPRPAKR